MLKGISIKQLKRINDERGSFTEIIRLDWKNLLYQDSPEQANFSVSYPGTIRAWHRHKRGQNDYFIVLKGTLKIGIFDEKTKELNEIISTGEELQLVRVPGNYWHGFKVLGNKKAFLLYFTTRLYNYSDPDEERRSWNDPKIIPITINGKKNDPRINKPWDWNYIPYR